MQAPARAAWWAAPWSLRDVAVGALAGVAFTIGAGAPAGARLAVSPAAQAPRAPPQAPPPPATAAAAAAAPAAPAAAALAPPADGIFCPAPVGTGRGVGFLGAAERVELGGGAAVCGDAVLFGYDAMNHALRLYTRTTFMGVPTQQPPADALALAEALWVDRPHVVIELGSYSGAGALWVAAQFELGANAKGRVITIDPVPIADASLPPKCASGGYPCVRATTLPLFTRRVTAITGQPDAPDVLAAVRAALDAARADAAPEPLRVAVIEDSYHQYDMVLSNLDAYAPFVTPGQLLQVQDTKLTRLFGAVDDSCAGGEWGRAGACGPADAVSAFLDTPAGEHFERDRGPEEAALYSQHAGGWLRRRAAAA
jgi:cephalosporin hydroxylase